MGESLVRSWLRHVEACQFAELNWKPSPSWKQDDFTQVIPCFEKAKSMLPDAFGNNSLSQLIKQAEIDVLGLAIGETSQAHFVDIAFHIDGLNYGGKEATFKRVFKKYVRSALLAKMFLPMCKSTIYFASPFISNITKARIEDACSLAGDVFDGDENIEFRTLLGDEFREMVLDEVMLLDSEVADTSELFLRSWQLIAKSKKLDGDSPATSTHIDRQSSQSISCIDPKSRRTAIIVSLYLAKYEHHGLHIGNQSETFSQISKKLGLKTNTLRNFRDSFDRHVDSRRQGWDKALSPEFSNILAKYGEFSEGQLKAEFSEIL